MEELNAFNTDDGYAGDGITTIVCGVLGIAFLVIVYIAAPMVGVLLSGLLFFGGTPVALTSRRSRPVASGLAFAGALPAILVFLVFWVWALAAVVPR